MISKSIEVKYEVDSFNVAGVKSALYFTGWSIDMLSVPEARCSLQCDCTRLLE